MEPNLLLIIAATCTIGGIALFLYTVIKKDPAKDAQHEDTQQRYHKIINNAHNEARAIIDTTSVASVGILADSKATSEHISENLDHVLQNIAKAHIEHLKQTSDEFTHSYDQKLNDLQEQLKNHTQQAIRESEERINMSLEAYIKPLAESAAGSHNVIDQRTEEVVTQVEKELAEYKTARMAKIDAQVQELIQKTYKEVLRKSIPDTLQEELILESLEKAKAEGGIAL